MRHTYAETDRVTHTWNELLYLRDVSAAGTVAVPAGSPRGSRGVDSWPGAGGDKSSVYLGTRELKLDVSELPSRENRERGEGGLRLSQL
jgi:hypothetical protein